uniref:Uncharacterized protein n=1 Tax=Glossina austeni TaxID=7395 RepID=A0A1A9UHN4_GLOAU
MCAEYWTKLYRVTFVLVTPLELDRKINSFTVSITRNFANTASNQTFLCLVKIFDPVHTLHSSDVNKERINGSRPAVQIDLKSNLMSDQSTDIHLIAKRTGLHKIPKA